MFKFLTGRWQSKQPNIAAHPKTLSLIDIPEDWMVIAMGQSPLHMLWYCQMVNKTDLLNKVEKPRRVWSEENDSYWQAMFACVLAVHEVEKNDVRI